MNISWHIKPIINQVLTLTKSWEKTQVRFIISSGRTGTYFLSQFFSNYFENVLSVHEPYPDLFDISMRGIRKNWKEQKKLSKVKSARNRQLLQIYRSQNLFYIESNPNLILLIPEIRKIFEDLKILFITRNIESYILSAYSKSPVNKKEVLFYNDNDHRKRLSAIDVKDKEYSMNWYEMDRLEKIAWWWNYSNKLIIENYNEKDSMLMKFEDLFESSQKQENLNKMITFFGLHDFQKYDEKEVKEIFALKSNETRTKLVDKFIDIEKETQANILKISASVKEKLGY